jgi:hypothetical protein
MSTPEHPPGSPEAVTHEYEEMTPEKRPQDHPRRNGRGLRFVTSEPHARARPRCCRETPSVSGQRSPRDTATTPRRRRGVRSPTLLNGLLAGSEDAIEPAERSFLRSASRHSRRGHDFNESCSCHDRNHTQRLPSRIARAVVIHVSVCAGWRRRWWREHVRGATERAGRGADCPANDGAYGTRRPVAGRRTRGLA